MAFGCFGLAIALCAALVWQSSRSLVTPYVIEVEAGGTVQADFHLRLAAVRQEVTVTASGREESTLETFASVTTLSGHFENVRSPIVHEIALIWRIVENEAQFMSARRARGQLQFDLRAPCFLIESDLARRN